MTGEDFRVEIQADKTLAGEHERRFNAPNTNEVAIYYDESSASRHSEALTELVPRFFALDHCDYARWLLVHIRELSALKT